MKTNSLTKKVENSFYQYREYVFGGLTLVLVILFFIVKLKIKSHKLKQFLHSNGYTETHFKSGKVKYPKILIKKDRVIIKNCYVKSFQEVQNDKDKWQKFLNTKIFSIEDKDGKTIIFLEV